MYTIIATPKMKNWIYQNLNKYNVSSNNVHLDGYYKYSNSKMESFELKLYSSNTLVISGNTSKRLYKKLIEESGEINTIGCDEVGVGDFFGPVVYVALTFDQNTIDAINEHNIPIKDSKKLKDFEILKIYSKIKDSITYKSQIVFDSGIDKNLNSIAQKVYYHNKNVSDSNNHVVIDLFTTENAFFKHTQNLNLKWPNSLELVTKADSIYNSVGLASIIARALFLIEMDDLEEKYNFSFPLGAGNVTEAANNFIAKYSKEELAKFAKTSFKTFDQLD